MTALYHRTCVHRVGQIITDTRNGTGTLFPHRQPLLGVKAIWLTHLPWAPRESLGLTSHTLDCDRMQFLLEVIDPHAVTMWASVRDAFEEDAVHQLEAAKGTRPDYWWITGEPQNVKLVEEP